LPKTPRHRIAEPERLTLFRDKVLEGISPIEEISAKDEGGLLVSEISELTGKKNDAIGFSKMLNSLQQRTLSNPLDSESVGSEKNFPKVKYSCSV
jgi:hypothetical protein